MRATTLVLTAAALLAGGPAAADTLRGDYLEVRTADVYTGPCFANGEVNLEGKHAVLAWRIAEGRWRGTPLDGLAVVAVVASDTTLGDPHAAPSSLRSLVIVDHRATEAQRAALLDFARDAGGTLLDDVVRVDTDAIELSVSESGAVLTAGNIAEVRTRPLHVRDAHCGNETVYYPPLVGDAQARPAFAATHRFRGRGLGSTWSAPDKRSAFVGTFAR